MYLETKARSISFRKKVIPTKQNFSCFLLTKRGHLLHTAVNRLPNDFRPSCSQHAEMALIEKHLKSQGLWKPFRQLLKTSYFYTNGLKKFVNFDRFEIDYRKKIRQQHIENKRFSMYIFRFLDNGNHGLAKPCVECTRWIRCAALLGIHYVVWYTDGNGNLQTFDKNDEPKRYMPKEVYIS